MFQRKLAILHVNEDCKENIWNWTAMKMDLGDRFNYKAACHNFKYLLFKTQMDI